MLKIEAAKRLAMPRPPWYNRCVKQVPKYLHNLRSLESPFPRTELKLAPSMKGIAGDDWGATWNIDFAGYITITFQTSFYKSCMALGLEWELVHTLQHEYMEAKLAVVAARAKYPNESPYVMAERDQQLGGKAHFKVIEELDGVSVPVYDKWLREINKYLMH